MVYSAVCEDMYLNWIMGESLQAQQGYGCHGDNAQQNRNEGKSLLDMA